MGQSNDKYNKHTNQGAQVSSESRDVRRRKKLKCKFSNFPQAKWPGCRSRHILSKNQAQAKKIGRRLIRYTHPVPSPLLPLNPHPIQWWQCWYLALAMSIVSDIKQVYKKGYVYQCLGVFVVMWWCGGNNNWGQRLLLHDVRNEHVIYSKDIALNAPEVERKVKDATSNEKWGPTGTQMQEISRATNNQYVYLLLLLLDVICVNLLNTHSQDLPIIMSVIWKRINDPGKYWRHVYKVCILHVSSVIVECSFSKWCSLQYNHLTHISIVLAVDRLSGP